MKYVCLSFDDARSDTYDVAVPIMKKYGLKATINVISDFITNRQNFHFMSAPDPMTWEQILQCQKEGFEIACHGRTHNNTAKDVLENIEDLSLHGIDVSNIGFASPNSCLTEENIRETGIEQLLKEGTLCYARTGIQVREESIIYVLGAALERITHSRYLYWALNKRNLIQDTSVKPGGVVYVFCDQGLYNSWADQILC